MKVRLAEVRKTLVAIGTVISIVIANNLVHGTALRWTNFAAGVVGAGLTWLIPNDTTRQNSVY